ncbi:MAG: ABC transporter ATP-binding protein [Asgard group archaeon]|nr:ABC transporter ATP-binding protein [Asgard group archaeon]
MSMRNRIERAYFDKEYTFKETISRIFDLASTQKLNLIGLVVVTLFEALVYILLPFLVREGLNSIALFSENLSFEFAKFVGYIYLIGAFVQWLIVYFLIRLEVIITAKSISDLRIKMFEKLQKMDLGFYDKMQTGKIMNRVMDDSNQAGALVTVFSLFMSSLILMVTILSIMFSVNVTLTLWILLGIPITIVLVLIIAIFLRRFARVVRKTRAAVNSAIQETVTGVSVIKGFNREEQNKKDFIDLNDKNLKANLKLSYTFSIFFPLIDFLSILLLFTILETGGGEVINGKIGIGDLYLFYAYTLRLFGPVIQLAQQVARIQAGSAATERIFSLLDINSKMKTGNKIIKELKGHIKYQNVTFSYNDKEMIFENMNLEIEPNTKIALVGHTGAGKSTFVSLLSRFYELNDGYIFIDGFNVQDLDIDSYRKHIGLVPQEPYLFSGSILENIKFGNINAKDKEIKDIISKTNLNEFINSLPEGLETDVREKGSRLSRGQRQLLTMARALLADPKILILDEATASVDAYTESLIQKSLEKLFENRTSIIVAHRLSTILMVDRILVFENGKIVGDGTHQELIAKNKTYKSLYETYYSFQGIDN